MLIQLINTDLELFSIENERPAELLLVSVDDIFSLPFKKSVLGRLVYVYKETNIKLVTSKKLPAGKYLIQ